MNTNYLNNFSITFHLEYFVNPHNSIDFPAYGIWRVILPSYAELLLGDASFSET